MREERGSCKPATDTGGVVAAREGEEEEKIDASGALSLWEGVRLIRFTLLMYALAGLGWTGHSQKLRRLHK